MDKLILLILLFALVGCFNRGISAKLAWRRGYILRTPTCRLAARDDPVVLVPELGRDVDVVGDRVRLLEGLKKFASAARPEVAVLVATDPVKVPEVPDGWKVKF